MTKSKPLDSCHLRWLPMDRAHSRAFPTWLNTWTTMILRTVLCHECRQTTSSGRRRSNSTTPAGANQSREIAFVALRQKIDLHWLLGAGIPNSGFSHLQQSPHGRLPVLCTSNHGTPSVENHPAGGGGGSEMRTITMHAQRPDLDTKSPVEPLRSSSGILCWGFCSSILVTAKTSSLYLDPPFLEDIDHH
jgi:hypothetical protein